MSPYCHLCQAHSQQGDDEHTWAERACALSSFFASIHSRLVAPSPQFLDLNVKLDFGSLYGFQLGDGGRCARSKVSYCLDALDSHDEGRNSQEIAYARVQSCNSGDVPYTALTIGCDHADFSQQTSLVSLDRIHEGHQGLYYGGSGGKCHAARLRMSRAPV